jgi:hypothetical protein
MAEPTNPTSPKVWAATAASVVVPILAVLVGLALDALSSGSLVIPEPWGPVAVAVLTAAGVFLAGRRVVDPRRVTNLTQAQVDELNEPLVP